MLNTDDCRSEAMRRAVEPKRLSRINDEVESAAVAVLLDFVEITT
jgi:hypothetical protein